MNGGGLTAEEIRWRRGIEAAAGGHGENFGDACGARDGNVFAGGQERRRRRPTSGLKTPVSVVSTVALTAEISLQAHLRDGIEEAGVDLQAFAVDDLRARGDVDVGADSGDFAVLE